MHVAAFQNKFLKNTRPGRQGGYPSKSLQILQGVYDVSCTNFVARITLALVFHAIANFHMHD
jgi:hypothetical protein